MRAQGVCQSIPPYKPRGPRSIHAGRGVIPGRDEAQGLAQACGLTDPATILEELTPTDTLALFDLADTKAFLAGYRESLEDPAETP